MILISHRCNINGKLPNRENTISYIKEAIAKGFDVEIDICKWDGKNFFLGHDEPQEAITPEWLKNNPDGKILMIKSKNSDELELHQSFYSNGIMEYESEIRNGIPDGKVKYWNIEGKLVTYANYENGNYMDLLLVFMKMGISGMKE